MSSMLVTGAAGFIGSGVCRALTNARIPFLGIDRDAAAGIVACDLRNLDALETIFQGQSFQAAIHLAAMLPGAAALDPLSAIEINARASVALLQRSIAAGVRRFVFGSSTSVYGLAGIGTPVDESVPAAPIDVYGASKRLVEIVGESLMAKGQIEFVSLRIATVIGPGARHTSSPWRSEIFEKLGHLRDSASRSPIRLRIRSPWSMSTMLRGCCWHWPQWIASGRIATTHQRNCALPET